jgi:hypothetical protein
LSKGSPRANAFVYTDSHFDSAKGSRAAFLTPGPLDAEGWGLCAMMGDHPTSTKLESIFVDVHGKRTKRSLPSASWT